MQSIITAQSDEFSARVGNECKILLRALNTDGVDRAEATKRTRDNISDLLVPFLAQNEHTLSNVERKTAFDKEFTERQQNPGIPGFVTGWEWINEATLGLKPGELWILGGYTGHGKSAATNQVANEIAVRNNPFVGLLLTCEMSDAEMRVRTIAAYSGVSPRKIHLGRNLTDADKIAIRMASDHLGSVPLWSCDISGISAEGIREQIHYVRGKAGRLDGIFLDHLHHMFKPKGMSDNQAISHNVRELKRIAQEENIFVWAAAQFSRLNNERPTLENFRWSGDIEQVGNVCLSTYFPKTKKSGGPNTDKLREAEWEILKSRNGGLWSAAMVYDAPKTWFYNRSE